MRCLRFLLPVFVIAVLTGAATFSSAQAGPLRQWLVSRMQGQVKDFAVEQNALVDGDTKLRDVPYGSAPRQKLDVYIPPDAHHAPVIVMVHGGGWIIGDKANERVVVNKGRDYLRKGYLFVSVNYRLVPDADPLGQAHDVATAIAFVQQNAAHWGGDATRIVVMGHSAGAHLVSLLAAHPALAAEAGAMPWRGTVSLDSAAMDVALMMQGGPLPDFYRQAFGSDPAYWRKVSPYDQLDFSARPMLLVCSLKRGEASCGQMKRFAEKARQMGVQADVLPWDYSHGDLNGKLGLDGAYTSRIDGFIAQLVKE